MNCSFLGITKLYCISDNKMDVNLSDTLKMVPLNCRVKVLSRYRDLLRLDLQKFDDPMHLKRTFTQGVCVYEEPSKKTIQTHLEITEEFIERIRTDMLND